MFFHLSCKEGRPSDPTQRETERPVHLVARVFSRGWHKLDSADRVTLKRLSRLILFVRQHLEMKSLPIGRALTRHSSKFKALSWDNPASLCAAFCLSVNSTRLALKLVASQGRSSATITRSRPLGCHHSAWGIMITSSASFLRAFGSALPFSRVVVTSIYSPSQSCRCYRSYKSPVSLCRIHCKRPFQCCVAMPPSTFCQRALVAAFGLSRNNA